MGLSKEEFKVLVMLQKFAFNNPGEYLVEFFDINTDERLAQKIIDLEKDKVNLIKL